MNKKARQYLGLLLAAVAYYLIHEGAHLLYALALGVFKRINFMGLGMQIATYSEKMTDVQIGIFCLVGVLATLMAAWVLIILRGKICEAKSPVFRASAYYITIAMLFIDPLYLSVLCGFFGGGDMNGISLLLPETVARLLFAVIGILHAFAFVKLVLPSILPEQRNLSGVYYPVDYDVEGGVHPVL